jgi:putative tryptophan/tyrosine transport system substrate-binding protein
MMKRWIFAFLAALALLPVHAQTGKAWRVAVLGIEPWVAIDGLRDGLGELGYIEGRNLTIEYRWAEGKQERLSEHVAELVRRKADVIVTVGTPAVLAAKKGAPATPVVMGLAGDPVGAGIVTSLSRPGGNVTGVSVLASELEPKRLELLKRLLPNLTKVGVLGNAKNPYSHGALKQAQRGAQALGLTLEPALVAGPAELDAAFESLVRARCEAVLVVADQMLLSHRQRIADLATRHRLPSGFTYREHVEAGGLFAYSTNYRESFRRSASYVDKVLKGAAPGTLPIEQVDRFELVLNTRTAKALNMNVPQALLLQVDQVIQ